MTMQSLYLDYAISQARQIKAILDFTFNPAGYANLEAAMDRQWLIDGLEYWRGEVRWYAGQGYQPVSYAESDLYAVL